MLQDGVNHTFQLVEATMPGDKVVVDNTLLVVYCV